MGGTQSASFSAPRHPVQLPVHALCCAKAVDRLRRFNGSVELDPGRVARHAGRKVEELLPDWASLAASQARINREVELEALGSIPWQGTDRCPRVGSWLVSD